MAGAALLPGHDAFRLCADVQAQNLRQSAGDVEIFRGDEIGSFSLLSRLFSEMGDNPSRSHVPRWQR